MSLLSDAELMTALGFCAGQQSLLPKYSALNTYAQAAIKNYVKWPIELASATIQYYDGNGMRDLVLKSPWVSSLQNVWFDQNGFYGQGMNAFSGNPLINGQDYVLALDGRCGLIRLLQSNQFGYYWPSDVTTYGRRPGGLSYARPCGWPLGPGNLKVQYTYGFPSYVAITTATWASGTVTFTTGSPHNLVPGWQVEVQNSDPSAYDGGYAVNQVLNATQFTADLGMDPGTWVSGSIVDAIPQDIKLAVVTAVSILARTTQFGYTVVSQNLGATSYSLQRDVEFGTVRQLLSRWRDTSTGGFLP